jgi:hypothetical protein
MSLFGRSILAKNINANIENTINVNHYFTSIGKTSGTDGSNLVFDKGVGNLWNLGGGRRITCSVWFKGTYADFPTDHMGDDGSYEIMIARMWTGYENADTNYGFFFSMTRSGIYAGLQSSGQDKQLFCQPINFSINFLDNNWHHIVFEIKMNSGEQGILFLDGVQQEGVGQRPWPNSSFTNVRHIYFNGDPWRQDIQGGFMNRNGGTLKFHNFFLDFNNNYDLINNYTKFNPGNSYVPMGNYGTSIGLERPDIFLYVDSDGNFQNGGTESCTVNQVVEGAGGWVKSTSGGPA